MPRLIDPEAERVARQRAWDRMWTWLLAPIPDDDGKEPDECTEIAARGIEPPEPQSERPRLQLMR